MSQDRVLVRADPVHVVAGVIRDPMGRILLARRTEHRDLAGLWEFPGGKREPGEAAEAALIRELKEELGLVAEVGDRLITVPQQYPHKRLYLDVHWINSYRGIPKGLEGQALAWVPLEKLSQYAMPPADRPVVAALCQPDRYLVTPDPTGSDADWLAAFDHALNSGIRRVLVRLLSTDPNRRYALLAEAVARVQAAQIDILVHQDVELAEAFGIGLHLPAAQLGNFAVRPIADKLTFSASCHDEKELAMAEQLGCNCVLLGPVRATLTHPGIAGIGWKRFAQLRETVSMPIYALGGMTSNDISQARVHGAQGIAAIRGLWNIPRDTN